MIKGTFYRIGSCLKCKMRLTLLKDGFWVSIVNQSNALWLETWCQVHEDFSHFQICIRILVCKFSVPLSGQVQGSWLHHEFHECNNNSVYCCVLMFNALRFPEFILLNIWTFQNLVGLDPFYHSRSISKVKLLSFSFWLKTACIDELIYDFLLDLYRYLRVWWHFLPQFEFQFPSLGFWYFLTAKDWSFTTKS